MFKLGGRLLPRVWIKLTEAKSVLLHLLKSSAWHHNSSSCNDEYIMCLHSRVISFTFLICDPETPSNKFHSFYLILPFSISFETTAMESTYTYTKRRCFSFSIPSWVLFYNYCYSTFMYEICLDLYMWSQRETHAMNEDTSMIHTYVKSLKTCQEGNKNNIHKKKSW